MGDSGLCWDGGKQDSYIQNWYNKKPFTTFSIRGNHENTNVIKNLPIKEKWGGKVYQVSPSIFYAKSGEIYNLCGYTCLAINGADSHDKEIRKENLNWWADEGVSTEALLNAYANLEKVNFNVDFIFSHTGGTFNTRIIDLKFEPTPSDLKLDYILRDVTYKCHYYGHYHQDKWTNNNAHCLYNNVYEIINGKEKLQHGINFNKSSIFN